MNANWEHIELEQLSDMIDGYLTSEESSRIMEHMQECDMCSDEYRKLTDLLASARLLPSSVPPEGDIWPDLRRALTERKEVVLPVQSGGSKGVPVAPRQRSPGSRRHWILAAAAVVLIVASSGITALVLRSRTGIDEANIGSTSPPKMLPSGAPVVRNAGFAQAEARYQSTIDELRVTVETQRSRLSPGTVRTVDHSLAVIDSAIAEARAALVADPNNRVLVDLLSATYQRKLELLRRTSELGSRI